MNPLTAQALRRITGEGASPPSVAPSNSNETYLSESLNHSVGELSSNIQGMRNSSRLSSLMSSYDGSQTGPTLVAEYSAMQPVLDMTGMHPTQHYGLKRGQSGLSVQVPQGPKKKYPGYPSPISPTPTAKVLYPSPDSETGSELPTPPPASPVSMAMREGTGSTPGRVPLGYEYYANSQTINQTGYGAINNARPGPNLEFVTEAKCGGASLTSPPRSGTPSPASPNSPNRPISPRTAMLKNVFGKQALQPISHNPARYPPEGLQKVPSTNSTNATSIHYHPQFNQGPQPCGPGLNNFSSSSSSSSPNSPPVIEIANGIETSTVSPISPTGTMLRYTSHRPVENGLLALRALSEAQVAEYRFWRPCGRRVCAFGCGGGNEGEVYAARKLFRDVEPVVGGEEDEYEEEGTGTVDSGVDMRGV